MDVKEVTLNYTITSKASLSTLVCALPCLQVPNYLQFFSFAQTVSSPSFVSLNLYVASAIDDILVTKETITAVATALKTELRLYGRETHALEKKKPLDFGALSPEVVALHAMRANKISVSNVEKSSMWDTQPPAGWDFLESAEKKIHKMQTLDLVIKMR